MNEPNWPVIEALSWFFGGAAEADGGLRSAQSGFEDAMLRLALCGRPAAGDVPVHETRATASRYDLPIEDGGAIAEKLVGQVERQLGRRPTAAHSEILARLRRLSLRHRATLELQFNDESWLCSGRILRAQRAALDHHWGISLALLCCTDRITAAAAGVNARREKRGREPVDVREALALLLVRTDAESKALVSEMVAESERAIGDAIAAYEAEDAR